MRSPVVLLLCAAAVASIANADSDFYGIYKATWAASKPHTTTLPWMLKYLPVFASNNSCVNNTCTCGEQGRAEIIGTSGFGEEDGTGVFGLHTILAAGVDGSRARASGSLSVGEIEKIVSDAIGDLSTYSPWLDHHFGLWAPSLKPYIDAFTSDEVDFLPFSWKDGADSYRSIVVHIPNSQVTLELIGPDTNAGDAKWKAWSETRHFFRGQKPPQCDEGRLKPLHMSHATGDLDEVLHWYSSVLGAKPELTQEYESGTRIAVFGANFSARVTLQFVQRLSDDVGIHSPAWFRKYLLNVSASYMKNYTSCWPVWGDNHYAVASSQPLTDVVARLQKMNWNSWHPFRGGCHNGTRRDGSWGPICGPSVIYVADPTGWEVQVSGTFPDDFLPGCSVDNGGFDGYCYTFCEGVA